MSDYSARRTLSVRVELIRQIRRRRTAVAFALALALPIIVVLAVKFGPSSDGSGGGGGFGDGDLDLVGLATSGAWNFALTMLFFSSGFLLVIIAAMFLGDTVASEASWSTLRYLLAAPVPRRRLLRVKVTVGLLLTLAVLLVLVVAAFLIGLVAFGGGTLASPLGGSLGMGESSSRLAVIAGYIAITLLVPAGVAFLMSVSTDVPLGAVGAAVVIVIIANILDAIEALGSLRRLLPTDYGGAWVDALGPVIVWDQMAIGVAYNVAVFVVLVGIAVVKFERKDILS
jgi:ABC-2 type transport system permease protein